MTSPTITLASGRVAKLPLFDPVVAHHFASSHSYVDTLLHQINVEKIYERVFSPGPGLYVGGQPVLLDIGANIGLVSIYGADTFDRIIALEPAPATFAVLKSMALGFPNIEPVCAALAPTDGPCEFFLNDINSTASSTVNTYGTRLQVQGLTLTSILSIHQLESVDVCKIDAEGAEGESLSFAQLEAAAPIVKSWYVESHNTPTTTWEITLGNMVRDLSRLGYHKQTITGMALWATK